MIRRFFLFAATLLSLSSFSADEEYWMWGHHPDAFDVATVDEDYKLPRGRRIDMADACRIMGIDKCCVVRWRGLPAYPYDDYARQFSNMSEIAWSVVDSGKETPAWKQDEALRLAARHPNLTLFFLDDFFCRDEWKKYPPETLAAFKCRARVVNPRSRLACVLYADSNGVLPEYKPTFDVCDVVSFWFWNGKELATMRAKVQELRVMIGPDKPVLLGIYLWDFGGKKPLTREETASQLETAGALLDEGLVNGLIFHCTPLVDLKLEAVDCAREWLEKRKRARSAIRRGNDATLRDTCWLWGHETGQVDGPGNSWKLAPATNYYAMADAARDMGLHNLNVIRWDMPDKAFRDTLRGFKRLTWPASAHPDEKHSTYAELGDYDFAVADEMPNVVGFELDDFFMAYRTNIVYANTPEGRVRVCPTVYPYEDLLALRRRRDAYARPLELRLVFYDTLFAQCKGDSSLLKPFVDLATTVTYWTWKAKDLPLLRENFARYRQLAPGKPTYLGIYLYDFGDKREMPMDMMELQMKVGLEMWRKGEIEGFVFLCSSICNRDFPPVAYARRWICAHGGERRE